MLVSIYNKKTNEVASRNFTRVQLSEAIRDGFTYCIKLYQSSKYAIYTMTNKTWYNGYDELKKDIFFDFMPGRGVMLFDSETEAINYLKKCH